MLLVVPKLRSLFQWRGIMVSLFLQGHRKRQEREIKSKNGQLVSLKLVIFRTENIDFLGHNIYFLIVKFDMMMMNPSPVLGNTKTE